MFGSRWTRRPPIGVPIDWSHPLAQGLMGFYVLHEGSGLVIHDATHNLDLNIQGFGSSNPWTTVPLGPGPGLNGSVAGMQGASAVLTTPLRAAVAWPITVASQVYIAGNPAASLFGLGPFGSAAPFSICGLFFNSVPGIPAIGWNSAGTFNEIQTGAGTTPAVGSIHTYSSTVASGSQRLYVDGALGAFATNVLSAPTLSSSPDVHFLRKNGETGAATNTVPFWGAWWNRVLSDDEHARIAANPWQVFRPRYPNTWMAPAAPGPPVILAGTATLAQLDYQFNESIVATGLSIVVTVVSTGAAVPGTVTYNSGTDLAIFTPTAPFLRGTKYQAVVSGATAADGTPMVPDTFVFDPGGLGRGPRYFRGLGRARLTA